MTEDASIPAPAAPDLESWLGASPAEAVKQVAPALAGLAKALVRPPALDARLAGAMLDALDGAGVAYLATRDQDAIQTLDAHGDLAVAIAPVGGAAEVAANLAVGLLFSIFPASPEGANASFLRPGDDVLAAGYVIHGAHTALVVSARDGVATFVLDPATGVFRLAGDGRQIEPQVRDFAVDMTNYRYWHHPVRLLVDDCIAGTDGPRGVDYTFRGTGSLVAEAHRILAAGGVYLEPADHRAGHQSGSARLLFEAFPIALLMEAAGGAASDTHRRILARTVNDLRQETPLAFGSAVGVKLVDDYHLGPTARLGEAPLFGRRGLYRK
jgi:fructose-1,6-bisphosphatase I